MKHASISAILFDFGGVLADEGFHNGLIAMANEQGLDVKAMPSMAMQSVYDSGFVLGKGSAADFWALLRERSGLQGEDDALTKRIMQGFVIRPWMIELVKQLREQGYITAILSDQTYWLDELEQKYHFSDAFDHIFNSYYLGKGKQDSSLFRDIAKLLELPPSSLLFIDDNVENVVRAREKGWLAIQYLDEDSFIVEMQKQGIDASI